jgi:hypothetical protein
MGDFLTGRNGATKKKVSKRARRDWEGDTDDAGSDPISDNDEPVKSDGAESVSGDMDIDEKENKDPDADGSKPPPPSRRRATAAAKSGPGKKLKGDGGGMRDKSSPVRRTTRTTRNAIVDLSGSEVE